MTRTFAGTRNYDFELDDTGDLKMLTGLDAVIEDARNALSVRLGECVLAQTRGMPFFEAAFNSFNPAQYEAAGRALLLSLTPDILAVKAFTVSRRGAVFTYNAQISTIYGDGEING